MVKTFTGLKSRLIIGILLTSFVGVFYAFYFVNKITANIRSSRVKIAEIERDIGLIDKIVKDKAQHESGIKLIKSTLPAEYYEVAFFTSEVERKAQENGLILKTNIDQKEKQEKSSYNSVVYSLEVLGNYSAVTNFLSQIAKMPYHTSIDYLKMTTEEDKLITTIKFRLFIQK